MHKIVQLEHHHILWRSQMERIIQHGFKSVYIPEDKDILLIVDDFTRPENIVTKMIFEFILSKIPEVRVAILVASGLHRVTTYMELQKRLGRNLKNVKVYTHNPLLSESPYSVWKEKFFCIGIGTVLPHTHVKFSGGSKLICPGISGVEAIRWFHNTNLYGKKYSYGKGYSLDMLDILVNSTINQEGEPTSLSIGEPRHVWKNVKVRAKEMYSVDIPEEADAVILEPLFRNADFIQSMNALQICKHKKVVKNGGLLCIKSNTPDGVGVHYLFQQINGLQPVNFDHNPVYGKILKDVTLCFICPNISRRSIEDYFDRSPIMFDSIQNYLHFVTKMKGNDAETVHYLGSDVMIPKGD